MNHIIMGIDPGLQSTGFGVIRPSTGIPSLLDGGVVKSSPKTDLPTRLASIYKEISAIIVEHNPEVVVVEDLFSNYEHPQTAVLMGHARGCILMAAAEVQVPVVVYTASMVKRALTGNGRASKVQIANMVSSLLRLDLSGVPDHVTDALALALCHHNATCQRMGERVR
jgi:crossover junction endodeoxyribonuclease RuvC